MTKFIGGPSLHLRWSELRCHNGEPYPEEWRKDRAVRLAEAFEAIRAVWDMPIDVISGYRTRAYNREIDGAEHSQHCEGLALDLRPPDGVTVREFWEVIMRIAPRIGVRGIGYAASTNGNYVHIDCRNGDEIATWRY